MRLRTLVLTLGLMLAAVPAFAVPLPAPRGAKNRELDLANTTWEGQDGGLFTVFLFEPDGTLQYAYNGMTYRNALWKRESQTIRFEINNCFREFRGQIVNGTLAGDSWNRAGAKWSTTLHRTSPK